MVSSAQRFGWALLLFCLIDIVVANSDRCQKTVSLHSTSGNISEPLYTDTSSVAGIQSCWFLSLPASQDYFTAIHIELVDFAAFFYSTKLEFSGLGTSVRVKPTPSCILYDNANCVISGAVTEMARHFPECEYSYTYVRMNGSAPRVLLNSGSNAYQEWKNETLKFNLQYIQFNCSDVIAINEQPGVEYVYVYSTDEAFRFDVASFFIGFGLLFLIASVVIVGLVVKAKKIKQGNVQSRNQNADQEYEIPQNQSYAGPMVSPGVRPAAGNAIQLDDAGYVRPINHSASHEGTGHFQQGGRTRARDVAPLSVEGEYVELH